MGIALEDGLKAPEYALPRGAREPRVIVEKRDTPKWPDSFDTEAARLPVPDAKALLERPLRLLLENGRNDWAFLAKVVPAIWRVRWDRAVKERWLEEHHCGGLNEMRRIIEEQLAGDPVRRLRTWAMFDCDGKHAGDVSQDAKDTTSACESWSIAYHRLRRRAIENYIPKETLLDWANRRQPRAFREEKVARWHAYRALPSDADRHHVDMKAEFHKQLAQHIWSDGENSSDGSPQVYFVSEDVLVRDGFGGGQGNEGEDLAEREQLFQSLFSRL